MALIFFILIPPATAVYLHPGTPSPTSVNTGAPVTFSNVNLTIRGVERIPVNNLTFKVYKNANLVGYVKFYINGTEIEDSPSGKFTVTNTTAIGSSWYDYGYQNGTDESTSQNYNFGYGYGYGSGEESVDITFLYTIIYTTHTTGTFYARLFVNSTNHTYASSNSQTFAVTSPGGGGPGPSPPTTEEEAPPTTKEQIENLFDIELEYNFSSSDTDGDGVNDTFTDLNGILQNELNNSVSINRNASFLISVDGDLDKLFIWDTDAGTITQVDHIIGTITDAVIDAENNTITVTVTINKVEGNWTYIEVTDKYPNNDLIVKAQDGRVISSDMIRRENGKIYVLDDPDVEYLFIYSYKGFLFDVILELTTDSVYIGESINALVTLINVGEPGLVNGTVTYTLYKENVVVWTADENVSVLGEKAFNKTISIEDLSAGEYTYEVVYSYGDDQTASSSKTFTVNARLPVEGIPLWIIIALVVILIIIIIVVYLFKFGYLYIEKRK